MNSLKNQSCVINCLNNIKSKLILHKVFEKLRLNKKLNIIKYNKILQKRVGIEIKDYKDYSQIEIVIIPQQKIYGRFINFLNTESKSYYHICLNDNEREIKKDSITKSDNAKKIRIIIDREIKSLKGLFHNCVLIKKIKFIKFNRKDIIDMGNMFHECSSLEELDLSNFSTNNVIDMSCMFYKCLSLKELNVSNFGIKKVKNMFSMFVDMHH
jgi:surface protein